MKNSILLLGLTVLFFSCGETNKMKNKVNQTAPKVQTSEIREIPKEILPTNIKAARIEENTLTLEVSYSGGCQEQTFDLVGSPMTMKSFPPKRAIALVRNSNGDTCRELIEETLTFDLTSMAYQEKDGSEIYLLLNGYEEQLLYTLKAN